MGCGSSKAVEAVVSREEPATRPTRSSSIVYVSVALLLIPLVSNICALLVLELLCLSPWASDCLLPPLPSYLYYRLHVISQHC